MAVTASPLEVVPLGGLGEFGMNMMAVSYAETTIVVDAGAMFPGPELLGVDLIVPDLSYLQGRRVTALVLTHGHEDHIGGVPYVWPFVDVISDVLIADVPETCSVSRPVTVSPVALPKMAFPRMLRTRSSWMWIRTRVASC